MIQAIDVDIQANKPNKQKILEDQLQRIRQESLIAARAGDYRRVAQLTLQAARVNQELTEAKVQQEIRALR